jgi:hypothetical protein
MAPEATGNDRYYPYTMSQVRWVYTASSKLLIEAGVFGVGGTFFRSPTGSTPNQISVLDMSRNFRYGAPLSNATRAILQVNTAGDVSYITHSHQFKVGYLYLRAKQDLLNRNSNSIAYNFIGTAPQSITYYAYPQLLKTLIDQRSLYAQDQWTVGKKLSLNLGLRLDNFNGHSPAVHDDPGIYVGARDFSGASNTPSWTDLNPRLGVAYNLFGDNKTVLKGNIGRFALYESLSSTVLGADPANSTVVSGTRTWKDSNGDYIPQDSELGPLSPTTFGQSAVVTRYADSLLHGFDVRPYAWEGSVSIQRELRPGLAVNAGFFRTSYGNFQITKNLFVSPSDYQSYCINGPTNPLLPGGGGQRICGLLDINSALFGHVNNLVTLASNYGKQTEIYNGFDFTVNARFGAGGLLTGGLSTSQTVTDKCALLAAVPEAAPTAAPTRFCRVSPPWAGATQLKLSGIYPLPWAGVRISSVWDYIPGPPTAAQYNATVAMNPEIQQQLGRQLAAGPNGVAAVQLIEPNSLYRNGHISFVNFTVSRSFALAETKRVEPKIELFNLFNANSVEQINTQYGPSWQNVTGVLPPRLVKVGFKVDW